MPKAPDEVVARGCRANEHGPLAQLVERLAGSQKVIGSIPIRSTIKNLSKPGRFLCLSDAQRLVL
jgi:hypothetical protein